MAKGKKVASSTKPVSEQPGAIRVGPELVRVIMISFLFTCPQKVTFVRPSHLIDPASAPFDLASFADVCLCMTRNNNSKFLT